MIKNKKGFSLIELLATIVILGIILTITIPMSMKLINETKLKASAESIKKLTENTSYDQVQGNEEYIYSYSSNLDDLPSNVDKVYLIKIDDNYGIYAKDKSNNVIFDNDNINNININDKNSWNNEKMNEYLTNEVDKDISIIFNK